MTEAFSAYIKTIAAVTVFAAFTEMLMPDNSFKKYINLVTGLLLLSIVLKPMLLLFDFQYGDMELSVKEKLEKLQCETILEDEEYYEKLQQDAIEDVYEQDLNLKISKDLRKKFGDEVTVEAEFEKNNDSTNYGSVLSVNIIGNCQRGEELKKYMEKAYHVAPDCITINFNP